MGAVVADIATVVDQVLRTTGSSKLVLFGHASGGHWAAMYATQHPDKLDALILLNSMYGVDAPWPLRAAFEDPQGLLAAGPLGCAGLRRTRLSQRLNLRIEDAHDLHVPVLYMRGARDHWSRPEDLEAMQRDLSTRAHSTFVTIPDGTHFLFLDRPEHGRTEMLRHIMEFLKSVR